MNETEKFELLTWLGWSFFICQQNLLTVRLWYKLWFLVKSLAHALAKGLCLLRKMGVQLILFTIWLTLSHLLQISVSRWATFVVICCGRFDSWTLGEQSRSLVGRAVNFSWSIPSCLSSKGCVSLFTRLCIQHRLIILHWPSSIYLTRKLQILCSSNKRFVISLGLVKGLLKLVF